jgi:hypothetical protein
MHPTHPWTPPLGYSDVSKELDKVEAAIVAGYRLLEELRQVTRSGDADAQAKRKADDELARVKAQVKELRQQRRDILESLRRPPARSHPQHDQDIPGKKRDAG